MRIGKLLFKENEVCRRLVKIPGIGASVLFRENAAARTHVGADPVPNMGYFLRNPSW
jgi:hypothetical protein